MTLKETRDEILFQFQNIGVWWCDYTDAWYLFQKTYSKHKKVFQKQDDWLEGAMFSETQKPSPLFFTYRLRIREDKIILELDPSFTWTYIKQDENGDFLFEAPGLGEILFRKAPEKQL
jgi:hypothetical protein